MGTSLEDGLRRAESGTRQGQKVKKETKDAPYVTFHYKK